MEKNIYLIYRDCIDDTVSIVGYIEGTTEDADKYCEHFNRSPFSGAGCVQWRELDKLN